MSQNHFPNLSNNQPIPPTYAAQFPPGYLEQYRGTPVVSAAIALIVLDGLMVGLRFWSRWIRHSHFRVDDAFIIVGLIVCWALNGAYLCIVSPSEDFLGLFCLSAFQAQSNTVVSVVILNMLESIRTYTPSTV